MIDIVISTVGIGNHIQPLASRMNQFQFLGHFHKTGYERKFRNNHKIVFHFHFQIVSTNRSIDIFNVRLASGII